MSLALDYLRTAELSTVDILRAVHDDLATSIDDATRQAAYIAAGDDIATKMLGYTGQDLGSAIRLLEPLEQRLPQPAADAVRAALVDLGTVHGSVVTYEQGAHVRMRGLSIEPDSVPGLLRDARSHVADAVALA
jgi:hypothetical protein